MSRLRTPLNGMRAQVALVATLVLLLVFLLIRSNHTSREAYDAAEAGLAEIEQLNIQLDAHFWPLLYELQTDFDAVTSVEVRLYEAALAYHELRHDDGSDSLLEMIKQKLRVVEDFKSNQSVMRNSRAIAAEMLNEARSRPGLGELGGDVYTVERHFLDFVARRDPESMRTLRERIADIENSGSALAETPEWETFVAHAERLIGNTQDMMGVMMNTFTIPVPQQISAELDSLAAWLEVRSQAAARYRFGMFGVALLLLAFSALKMLEVRRYYRMIERSKHELEERVEGRTRELSEANEALQAEIHERHAVESQLRIAQKLESIGQLAAGIAHEVNTPTQYVSDNVAFIASAWHDLQPVLEDYERSLKTGAAEDRDGAAIWKHADVDYLREEVPAALTAATGGLNQIARIVRAIRDFSHPGNETLQAADLNRAIENAVTVARNEWKYVAEVSLEFDPSLPKVPCNVSAFNQVILNLVVNSAQALKSQRRGSKLGRIVVSTRAVDGEAEIVVEDDGPGVPEEIRHKIFDPFFTTKEVGEGTGQGLAIAFRVITKQHGGTLTAGAASGGRGARFTIRLPLEQPRADAAPLGSDTEQTDAVRRLELHAEGGA